jgi:hypothetical protein
MRVRINRHYQEIMERDNFVTAEKVEKPLYFDPFGQTEFTPLAII